MLLEKPIRLRVTQAAMPVSGRDALAVLELIAPIQTKAAGHAVDT